MAARRRAIASSVSPSAWLSSNGASCTVIRHASRSSATRASGGSAAGARPRRPPVPGCRAEEAGVASGSSSNRPAASPGRAARWKRGGLLVCAYQRVREAQTSLTSSTVSHPTWPERRCPRDLGAGLPPAAARAEQAAMQTPRRAPRRMRSRGRVGRRGGRRLGGGVGHGGHAAGGLEEQRLAQWHLGRREAQRRAPQALRGGRGATRAGADEDEVSHSDPS